MCMAWHYPLMCEKNAYQRARWGVNQLMLSRLGVLSRLREPPPRERLLDLRTQIADAPAWDFPQKIFRFWRWRAWWGVDNSAAADGLCKRRRENPSLEATEWFGCAGVKIRQLGSLCLIRASARDEARGTLREGTTCGSD
jgi:hypothetical protein